MDRVLVTISYHSEPESSGKRWQGSGLRLTLPRELGVSGATMMGLGAIVGSDAFVSIGVAAGIAEPAVVVAIASSPRRSSPR